MCFCCLGFNPFFEGGRFFEFQCSQIGVLAAEVSKFGKIPRPLEIHAICDGVLCILEILEFGLPELRCGGR